MPSESSFTETTVLLKQQLESSKKQLRSAHCVLRDITNEKLLLKKQREISEKKLAKSKELQSFLEEEVSELHEQNIDLSMALSALESELSDDTVDTSYTDDENFTFQTKLGRRYSPSIRKLYYTLLSQQVPTAKVPSIIRTVVKCFNSSINIEHLKLPQRSCASYMRWDELKTISNAQKATVLSEDVIREKRLQLNSDGTTKQQKKLGAVAINSVTSILNFCTCSVQCFVLD